MTIKGIILSSLILLLSSCGNRGAFICADNLPEGIDTISIRELGYIKGKRLIIRDTIDLGNRKCIIPEGVSLFFKGGAIKNGTLEGNMTKLKCTQGCFNRVRILGSWYIGTIKSSFFSDLSYDNALKDVVALSNSDVKNSIIIEKGVYQVSANKNGDVCIPVKSNTELVMNGTIKLIPNGYTNYYIIQAEGKNIIIKGKGTIVGDKHTHTGKKGEWGMGINLDCAHHVIINGLTVKECWGDCIYVGGESSDVWIENCLLDHGRRQGISITSADGVTIKNCTITNVGGTAPEYAIDIEPNKGEMVDNVTIKNVSVSDCLGGFLVYGKAENAHVGRVRIFNSSVIRSKKSPVFIQKCQEFNLDSCSFKSYRQKEPVYFEDVDKVCIRRICK